MQVAEPSPLATRAAETAPDAAHPLRTKYSRSDHGLHEDVRLLRRLLGQTVRQHEGQEAFERIEFNSQALDIREPQRPRGRRQPRRTPQPADGARSALRHPRLQLFPAFGQYRRGSASAAAAGAGGGRGRKRGERAEPREKLREAAQGLDRRRQDRAGSGARLDLAGADRPSDRGQAQEPARRRARDLLALGRARAFARQERAFAQRGAARRASRSCGRRSCCAIRAFRCATRSRTL